MSLVSVRRQRKARAATSEKTGVGMAELGRGQCTCDNNNNNAGEGGEGPRDGSLTPQSFMPFRPRSSILMPSFFPCPPYIKAPESPAMDRLHHDEPGTLLCRTNNVAVAGSTGGGGYIEPVTIEEEPLAKRLSCHPLCCNCILNITQCNILLREIPLVRRH